MAKMLKFKAA